MAITTPEQIAFQINALRVLNGLPEKSYNGVAKYELQEILTAAQSGKYDEMDLNEPQRLQYRVDGTEHVFQDHDNGGQMFHVIRNSNEEWFDVGPKVYGEIADFLGRVFNQPLVPPRSE